MKVGLIGCGNISATYFKNVPLFKGMEVAACADIMPEAAKQAAERWGVKALSVDELLADSAIDAVVNITIPAAHCEVSCRILEAGKHLYSEKPLGLDMAEGRKIEQAAAAAGKQACCAPDTFMGGAHQLARQCLDDGAVGKITSGSCHVLNPGMEMWHPNPDFFFQPGGGPILDLGPYYITNLVNLLGPVKRLASMANAAQSERTITSEPRAGEKVKVEVQTTVLALLEFVNGAVITLSASWDVWAHRHANMELYGTEGSLYVPDPNFFNGDVIKVGTDGQQETLPPGDHPLYITNEIHEMGKLANYRAIGLAEMADAVAANREPRCSLSRALHVLEVMAGILAGAEAGKFVEMETSCERPAHFGAAEAGALFKELPVPGQEQSHKNE